MTVQQYCLRWNNHQPNFISVFSSLLSNQSLVDVTLAAEGKHLQAHKVVLSACSSYFQSLFTINPCKHPIVILKDVKFLDLKVMVDFMYHGEVNVSQEQLPCILKTAEMLKIKGLTEIPVDQSATRPAEKCELQPPSQEDNWNFNENVRITSPPSPTGRRKRLKKNICSTGSESESATTSNEILLGTVENINVIGTILKSDSERYNPPENTQHSHHQQNQHSTPQKCNGLSVPIVQQPGPSHEVADPDPTHHVSLQVTPHDLNPPQTVDCSPLEIPRITTTQQTAAASPPHKPSSPPPQEHIGTKRGRFLMRQPRIKRESDPPQDLSDSDIGPKPSTSYLTVPPVRIERQCSDPLPTSVSPTSENLLSVSEHILMKQHSHPLLPTKPIETNNPRSSHCPAVRSGPALGCNYCWNTVDTHGRILRRKTKYHCPECQTNLCIVPCFQEYHKCQEGHSGSTQQQSSSVMLTSTVKMFPKTN